MKTTFLRYKRLNQKDKMKIYPYTGLESNIELCEFFYFRFSVSQSSQCCFLSSPDIDKQMDNILSEFCSLHFSVLKTKLGNDS